MNPAVKLNVVIEGGEVEPVLAVIQQALHKGLAGEATVKVERANPDSKAGSARHSAIKGL